MYFIISFQIDYDYLKRATSEDFVKGEVIVGDSRHLIFATAVMLENLARAKTWYGDGTFKIASTCPFGQLYTICFFAKKEETLKLFPGCFVLMARKRKDDYTKVIIINTNNNHH